METKRAKVIMLPANVKDITPLGIQTHGAGKDLIPGKGNSFNPYYPQHLYFVIDDRYIHGEPNTWCYNEGKIFLNCVGAKKIIATTDSSLYSCAKCNEIENFHFDNVTHKVQYCNECGSERFNYLPQPSQAFIEKYCKVGGIDEVLIECECYSETIKSSKYWKLKVDPTHNTITIHSIKNSWSRKEVVNLLQKLFIDHFEAEESSDLDWSLDKWIRENL